LIVDDDITINELEQAVFQGRDWRIATAYDGTGAISSLNLDKPDLILLDLMLPDLPGEQVIESIRKSRMKTKVIVVTGRHVTKKDFENFEGIVVWVLRKPYPMVDLRALIDWFEGGALVTPKISSVGDV
jgi:DNA-binding response OmpR family regulator